MKVLVNSKEHDTQAPNVAALVEEIGLKDHKVAVAINNEMIPKHLWEDTVIAEGVEILIIQAFCGG